MIKIKPWQLADQQDYLDEMSDDKINEFLQDNWTLIEDGLFEVIEGLFYEDNSCNVPVEQHLEFIKRTQSLFKKGGYKK